MIDDSDPQANAFGNNMKIVRANEYDDGSDGGNGNLTQLTEHVDAGTTRVTTFIYDFRNRRTEIDGEVDFFQINTYDNLNRVTMVQRKDTTSGGNLIAQSETKFDDRGREYQSIVYAVDPSTGTTGNTLADNTWYDPDGNVIKQQPAGSQAFSKMTFDGLSRQTAEYTAYFDGSGTDDSASLTDNKVFEQVQTNYDEADNVIGLATLARYHDGSGNGALVAGSNARPSYTANWYDGVGHQVATAEYGNQGNDSTTFTRPDSPPDSTNEILVTQTRYNEGGELFETIDAMGIINRTFYDNAARTIRTIENAVDGVESPGDDENVTTEMAYNADGNILTLTAKNPATADQVTTYLYGTTLADSDIARNDLMRGVIYPDSGDGSDQVTYNYNRQGQITAKTDQNGSVHAYSFDLLGRPISDAVPTLAAGVDGAVRRIDTAYEVRGKVNLVTSFDNDAGSGTPVNQVERTFNDFVQLAEEAQEHDGAVDGSTLSVGYACADGSANTIRPTSVTYPDGRVLSFGYGAADSDDDMLSRIGALDWNGTGVSEYTYLGVASIVKENYPQPSVALDYIGSGNSYSGFDRFGRIVDQKWTAAGGTVDQFRYGYDRNSNRIYRENVVAGQQATPVHLDELYGYDAVNRLTSAHRGQLVNNDRITNHSLSQTWQLDATGNWQQFSNYDQVDAAEALVQQRSHNEVNEITNISETVGDQWTTPQHDRNGNMTTIPQPNTPTSSFTCVYDAWNRLVKLLDGTTTIAEYSYDGQNWRTEKTISGTTTHFYYSAAWQVLEQREGTSSDAERQFVWGLRYIDDLVLRDRDTSGNGTLDERLYALQDANWNVTAIINPSAAVQERYAYTAYGVSAVLTASFGSRTSTDFDWEYRYTGRRLDLESDLYYCRARYYDPGLGRFVGRDPIYSDPNLYRYVHNNPVILVDPSGLSGDDYPSGTAQCSKIRGWRYLPRGDIAQTILKQYDPEGDSVTKVGSTFVQWYQWHPGEFRDAWGCCCCTKIGFVQVFAEKSSYSSNLTADAEPPNAWAIDPNTGAIPYPFSTTRNPCGTKEMPSNRLLSIDMRDRPSARVNYIPGVGRQLRYLWQRFEACVVCLSGREGINQGFIVYACMQWEHKITLDGGEYRYTRSVSGSAPVHGGEDVSVDVRPTVSGPSEEWKTAVKRQAWWTGGF